MNKSILTTVLSAALLAAAQSSPAGEVTGLTSFTAGTPAVASQVNGNFTAVKTAVDNNHARITTLETGAANPSFTGTITLVPSTATAGNIMKGTTPFLHDYGTGNTFLGESAGNFTMTGFSNTASGVNALSSNTTGGGNTASGMGALAYNTTGYENTACGALALRYNTTGYDNTANGWAALSSNTTGNFNTASGMYALPSNTTGHYNIAIGHLAGSSLTTGSYNIAIDNSGVAGESYTIRIGDNQTRAFIAGLRGVTTANANAIPVVIDGAGQLGTVSSSRHVKDDIADMGAASSTLMKLRPVTFHYKSDRNPKGRSLQIRADRRGSRESRPKPGGTLRRWRDRDRVLSAPHPDVAQRIPETAAHHRGAGRDVNPANHAHRGAGETGGGSR